MLLLNKLKHLRRVPLHYRIRLLIFQIKKSLHLNYSPADYKLNSFLTSHLLRFNAFLLNEDKSTYTSDFYIGDKKAYRITLRKSPSSDFAVFDQVFILKEYKALVDLIKSSDLYSGRPLNIIDAGGNIGTTSIFLNKEFPGSRFVIVEPDNENFVMLTRNIQQNKFSESTLVHGGVWNKDTFLQVNRNFRDGNDWSVSVTESDVATGLRGFAISSLMKQSSFDVIDILKIDIEGSEKQLFSDESIVTEFLSKTKYIAIEIHDEFDCRDQINMLLTKNNFEFFLLDGLTIGFNSRLVH